MKKFLIGLLILIVLLGAAAIYLNTYLENQLKGIIENELPQSLSLEYKDLEIDSWQGNASLSNATVRINITDTVPKSEVKNATVKLTGFNHWTYFKSKDIYFNEVKIHADTLTHYRQPKKKEQKKSKDNDSLNNPIAAEKLDRKFKIKDFQLTADYIQILKPESAEVALRTAHFDFSLKNVTPAQSQRILRPFEYEDVLIKTDSLYFKMNAFDALKIGHLEWNGTALELLETQLLTEVSRSRLSELIDKERDHVNFQIKRLHFKDLKYGQNEGKFFFNSPKLILDTPALNIYRDKRVADDYTIKPLYSKMLRELQFDLMIDTIQIQNGTILYTERVNNEAEAGQLQFDQLNATLTNVGNTYNSGKKKTAIAIDARFMQHAPITIDWDFDINDPQDKFKLIGTLSHLPANELEAFTGPNLGVEMTGNVARTYFTIYGTDYSSHIDMQMTYDDFKVSILNKEKKRKKWLVSTLANIFIAKSSKNEEGGFKEGSGDVNRDQNKSFFNYLWLNLKEGMLKTVTALD